MRSLRSRLRKAVLAVPMATAACLTQPPTGTTPSTGSTSAGATSGTGASTSGSGSSGGTGSTGGSTGNSCPVQPRCPIPCHCTIQNVAGAAVDAPADLDAGYNLCECRQVCPAPSGILIELGACSGAVADAGAPDGGTLWDLTCYYEGPCGVGRRPEGLCEPSETGAGVGAYFARVAHLEAASVAAFRRLARELRALGAPEALVARARLAAREEARHARLTRRLAERHGAGPIPVRLAPVGPRSLEELALENAREGCVGETFGAALVAWQALRATDPEVREVGAALFEDEAGHAELAWELDAWVRTRLAPEAQARVDAAREAALRQLEQARSPSAELCAQAGLPDAPQRALLLAELRSDIWSGAVLDS